MECYCYSGLFVNIPLRFRFKYPDTALYFGTFLKPCFDDPKELVVEVLPWEFEETERLWGFSPDPYVEYSLSISAASDILISQGGVAIHAGAILYQGKAYLFVAESGTGKSTQLKNWMNLYGSESLIMNGDKPLLHLEKNGSITVHPSPWKGKENWGDDGLVAPLGGVILLKQGKEERLSSATPSLHGPRLLSSFFSRFSDKETLHGMCKIGTRIWKTVPVWQFVNTGTESSTRFLHDEILRQIDK